MQNDNQIICLIAAAGKSARMGQPKCLLKIGDETFLEKLICSFHVSFVNCIVTLPSLTYSTIANDIVKNNGALLAFNKWPSLGLTGSIRSTLAMASSQPSALFVCPIDSPFITPQLIAAMISALLTRQNQPTIIVPHYEGKQGHPALFSHHYFKDICCKHNLKGPESVICQHRENLITLPWHDKKITLNLNNPEDLLTLEL